MTCLASSGAVLRGHNFHEPLVRVKWLMMHYVIDCRSIHRHMAGIGFVARNLVNQIEGNIRSHQITVLIGSDPPEDLKFNVANINVVQVDAAMIDEPFEQFGLPGVLEDLHANVYINTSFSVPALKTTAFQISIIHDVVFEDRPEWVEPRLCSYLKRWSRFATKHADRVVTVSNYSRERIISVYGAEASKVVRIYNGMRESAFSIPSREVVRRALLKFGLYKSDGGADAPLPYILYLGSTEPKKGTPELLAAFARLVSRAPKRQGEQPLQLIIAGGKSGPDYDLVAAVGKTGCADRIRHVGYVEEEEKKALLASCSLFVYPSHYEGFGLPPLEAMALGVPCVVNDATSIPEIVGDAAFKVDVRDQDAFVKAMERGLRDQEFRDRARVAGPERARMFTWERAANELLDLCESLR